MKSSKIDVNLLNKKLVSSKMVIKEGFVIKMTVIKTRSNCISDLMDNSQGLVILEKVC